ncbi:MAG: HEAT repeat domain-containing protein [Candidatus Neomarinimicrobiota bacterium]
MKNKSILIMIIMTCWFSVAQSQASYARVNKLAKKCARGKIASCNKLNQIAKNDRHEGIRIAAVKNLINQSVLEDIFRNDTEYNVKEAALEAITDQNILLNIAKTGNMKHRRIAVDGLSNQQDIVDVAMNDNEWWVREAAVRKITDQNILVDFAHKDDNYSVRFAALNGIANQEKILNIIINGEYLDIKLSALNILNEDDYYKNIVEIIDQNINSNHNLSAIGALKIIPKDKTLLLYYDNLEVILNIKDWTKQYANRKTWRRLIYNIDVKTDTLTKSFIYRGSLGGTIVNSYQLSKTHLGRININEICEFLLSSISKEDLSEISKESDIYYLRETANRMLQN